MQADSLTDPLTGLPNTRYLFMQLARELRRAERLQSEVAVIVVDVDGLRAINNVQGHAAADDWLCEVARVLREVLPPHDVCARWFSDKFVVVRAGCGSEEANNSAAAISSSVEQLARAVSTTGLQMSVTTGVATYPMEAERHEALLDLALGRARSSKLDRRQDN